MIPSSLRCFQPSFSTNKEDGRKAVFARDHRNDWWLENPVAANRFNESFKGRIILIDSFSYDFLNVGNAE
jgi:hypothetical protein